MRSQEEYGRNKPPSGYKRKTMPARAKFGGSIAKLNRWTGKPHENKRELERHARRAA